LMGRLILKGFVGSSYVLDGGGLLYQAAIYALEYLVGGFVLAAAASAVAFMAAAPVCLVMGRWWRNS
jgi:hypothetical protein